VTEPLPRKEPVEIRSAAITGVNFEERIIQVIAVPYDEEAVVPYHGEMVVETVAPGAFEGIETREEHVTANRDHSYERTFGKVLSYRSDDPVGLVTHIHVSNTSLGDETLQLAHDGVLKASVGMLVRRSDQIVKKGSRRIKRAFLDHVSLVPNPAYRGAGVLAVRQEQGPRVEDEGSPPAPTPNLDKVMALLGMLD
jgi:HK97 family phage prohead protease